MAGDYLPSRTLLLAVPVALLISSACAAPTGNDGGQEGDPQVLFLYADRYPVPRPGSSEVAFVRWLGVADPDSVAAGLYLADPSTASVRLLHEGLCGRPTWLSSSAVLFSDLSNGSRLTSYDLGNETTTVITDHGAANPHVCMVDSVVVFESGPELLSLDLTTGVLTTVTASGLRMPSFSPSGEVIAASEIGPSGISSAIVLIDRNGSHVRNITPFQDHVHNHYPAWNTAGTRLVFQSLAPDSNNKNVVTIYGIDSDGTSESVYGLGFTPAFDAEYSGIFYAASAEVNQSELRIFWKSFETGHITQVTF